MLSSKQLAQYDQDRCLLVSGLIPEDTLANAEATMWSVLGMDRNDPTSWSPLPEEADGLITNTNRGLVEHFGL